MIIDLVQPYIVATIVEGTAVQQSTRIMYKGCSV
jgi:hypothetical protein